MERRLFVLLDKENSKARKNLHMSVKSSNFVVGIDYAKESRQVGMDYKKSNEQHDINE